MVINANFVHSKGQSRPAIRPAGASMSIASRGGTDAMQRQSILEMRRNANVLNADLTCATNALAAANIAIKNMQAELISCRMENKTLKEKIAKLEQGGNVEHIQEPDSIVEHSQGFDMLDKTAESSFVCSQARQAGNGGARKNRKKRH